MKALKWRAGLLGAAALAIGLFGLVTTVILDAPQAPRPMEECPVALDDGHTSMNDRYLGDSLREANEPIRFSDWTGYNGAIVIDYSGNAADAPIIVRYVPGADDPLANYSLVSPSILARPRVTYRASAFVAAANPFARGKRVAIAIRQRQPGGSFEAQNSSDPVVLTSRFQRLEVSMTTRDDNAVIQVQLSQLDAAPQDAFCAAAINLVAKDG